MDLITTSNTPPPKCPARTRLLWILWSFSSSWLSTYFLPKEDKSDYCFLRHAEHFANLRSLITLVTCFSIPDVSSCPTFRFGAFVTSKEAEGCALWFTLVPCFSTRPQFGAEPSATVACHLFWSVYQRHIPWTPSPGSDACKQALKFVHVISF